MPTVYVTAPSGAAEEIARTLVAERLAACVNRVACESTYRWEGEVVEDDEVILLAKTTDDRYEDLVARVVDCHPYDVPCVERFDATDVFAPFADWIDDETTPSPD
jgi:periplasmic divalent cation tolerance protein